VGGEEHKYNDGTSYWIHRFGPSNGKREPWPEPRFTLADGIGELADPDTLNKVYDALAVQLSLSEHHRKALEARGLKGGLQGNGYRTLGKGRVGAVRKLIEEGLEQHLPNVPGFFVQENDGKRYWSLAGAGGLLIPVRDQQGRLIAWKIRPDKVTQGRGKYNWLTSRDEKKNRHGPSPGSPTHFPLRFAVKDRLTIRITEGALKADVATRLSGIWTIGLPGVGAWKRAAKIVEELGAKTVLVAYDADACKNQNVGDALYNLVHDLHDRLSDRVGIQLELWDPGDGKGIDDVLAAGKPVNVLSGEEMLAAVERIRDEARKMPPPGSPGVVAANNGEGPNEAIDDPHRLARCYRECYRIDGQEGFHYWREEWARWASSAYRLHKAKEIQAELNAHVRRQFEFFHRMEVQQWRAGDQKTPAPVIRKVAAKLIGDVAQALGGMSLLSTQTEAPAWLSGDGPWAAEEVLACHNGLIHLPSVVEQRPLHIIPATPRFFSLNALDYDFDMNAPEPLEWLAFLRMLWPKDQEAINLLQEWCGYCLLPDTSQQKILMLIGPKRSGKGTIARVLSRLIGLKNVCAPTLASLGMNFGLWPLVGKSLAIIADARLSNRSDIAQVIERLLSISGEDTQTIDRKNLSQFIGKLPVRFMILSNELPKLSDSSGAVAGRMVVLRLTESFFGREDTRLIKKMYPELPGILLWAIAGWHRLSQRGHFEQPKSAKTLVRQLEDLASPIAAFVRERCELGSSCNVLRHELYQAWVGWQQDQGFSQRDIDRSNQIAFGRDLSAALPQVDPFRPRVSGGQRVHAYKGIRLRGADEMASGQGEEETENEAI